MAASLPKPVTRNEVGYFILCHKCGIKDDPVRYKWKDVCNHPKWCELYKKTKDAAVAATKK